MFSDQSARSSARPHSRLLAVCTTAVLSLGVLALGPAGIAHADTAAPHHVSRVPAAQVPHPTLDLPRGPRSAGAPTKSTAATAPRYDVDGDGYEDFLTQEDDGSLEQRSSASGEWTDLGVGAVRYLDVLTPGDLDPDLPGPEVLTLSTTGDLSLWDHTALPSGNPVWTGKGWQAYNKLVGVGDISGDGIPDLLARTYTGDLYLFRGTGDGTAPFAARVKIGYGFGIYDQLIGGGDLTATGHQTLVARDLAGDLWLYDTTGNPASPLKARVKIGYGWNIYNQLIGLGDELNAHGQILGRTPTGDLYFYSGKGVAGGQLTSRVLVGSYWNDNLIASQGSNPFWGKNNLFGLNSNGDLYFYYGMKTGGLGARIRVGSAGAWKGAKLVAPVSLTGADDRSILEVYQGGLWNDTADNTRVSGSWGTYNVTLGPGDLNGDGRSDLLTRDTGGVLWMHPGHGDGTLGSRVRIGTGWNAYNSIVGAGDIDGDGRADIVARTPAGHLYFYKGTGSGTTPFKARVDLGGGWNTYTRLVAPGDLDGDGRADIAGATSAGELYRYSGTGHSGSATFKSRARIGTSGWNGYTSLM